MRSEDRAARCHFYGGDAPAEQQDEAVTVAGAKHAGVLGQGRNDVLGDLVRSGSARLLIADVQVIAADQPHAQHNLRHARILAVPLEGNECRGGVVRRVAVPGRGGH